MNKYKVGDKVRVKNHLAFGGCMISEMLEEFGGTVRMISKVVDGNYNFEGDPIGYEFNDEDIECVEKPSHVPQRIEVPVPGGHLVAEAVGGEDYPAIHVFFISSGGEIEHDLCFAEVCVEDNPDVIRVGTYYADFEDVKDVFEYPMDVWREGNETLD